MSQLLGNIITGKHGQHMLNISVDSMLLWKLKIFSLFFVGGVGESSWVCSELCSGAGIMKGKQKFI